MDGEVGSCLSLLLGIDTFHKIRQIVEGPVSVLGLKFSGDTNAHSEGHR
jgi:hypothetical protein